MKYPLPTVVVGTQRVIPPGVLESIRFRSYREISLIPQPSLASIIFTSTMVLLWTWLRVESDAEVKDVDLGFDFVSFDSVEEGCDHT